MIEQLNITTEIRGAVQDVTMQYRYYGAKNIELDEVYLEGQQVDLTGLENSEIQKLYSCIRNHKLQAVAI